MIMMVAWWKEKQVKGLRHVVRPEVRKITSLWMDGKDLPYTDYGRQAHQWLHNQWRHTLLFYVQTQATVINWLIWKF